MIVPCPRHVGQVCWIEKKPCWTRTCPLPLHRLQVERCVPGSAPAPRHRPHSTLVGTSILTESPATACSSDRANSYRRSAPRKTRLRPRRPALPKISPKTSPNMSLNASAPPPKTAAGLAGVHSGVAELIVGGALLRVGEDFVGFLGFLEAGFGLLVVGIAVRMVFHGQTPVSLLQFGFPGVSAASQDFVVIPLGHAPPFQGLLWRIMRSACLRRCP